MNTFVDEYFCITALYYSPVGALDPDIPCFPGQLNQVFMNILANAIDLFDELAQEFFWHELETKSLTITIQTSLLATQNAIEIRIADNGKGMTATVQARIFDHLFTTKDPELNNLEKRQPPVRARHSTENSGTMARAFDRMPRPYARNDTLINSRS